MTCQWFVNGAEVLRHDNHSDLSARRVRLFVYAALVVIALVAIWFVDRRAMTRMHESITPPTAADFRP